MIRYILSILFLVLAMPIQSNAQARVISSTEMPLTLINNTYVQPLSDASYTPVATIAPIAPTPVTTAPISSNSPSVVSGCGSNSYSQYIYAHESGCNLNAVNSIGCRGIGQACPGSKLPCGADYACQDAFFTSYANAAYGGWSGAYNHWLAYSWW